MKKIFIGIVCAVTTGVMGLALLLSKKKSLKKTDKKQ